MAQPTSTFGSFAVRDLASAQHFYADTLGLDVESGSETGSGDEVMWLRGPGDQRVLVYAKADHTPAGFTVFNLEVESIEDAVDEITARGASFEKYDGMGTDERGIARHGQLAAAWLTDPSGNVVAVMQRNG